MPPADQSSKCSKWAEVMNGFIDARRILSVVTLTVVIHTAGCASISPQARLEQKMVYQPVKYPDRNWDLAGREFLDAWFTAEDGTQLHGWYSPHPNPRAVALFCHGNAGNLTHRLRTLRILRDRHDLAVLIFDYRGYGRSEGSPSEIGLIQDAKAACQWLSNHTNIEETDITLLGRSLGGGVAVQLAADDGARGLVLASTFTSLPDVGAEHAPLLVPKLVMRNRFNSINRIPEYDGPFLMSHGDADELIPVEQGRQLFEAAPGPKRFIRIPDAGHNDPQPESYREAFDQFLTELPPWSRPLPM